MKKIKVLRHSNRARDINLRPTTTSDVTSRQVPMRVVRNIRRGHLIGGMRDIAHIGWKSWEQSVAEMQRLQERNLHKKANRFHNALKSARTLCGRFKSAKKICIQAINEEVEVTNEVRSPRSKVRHRVSTDR